MKEISLAMFLGLALLAAPAAKACDYEKSDSKVMLPTKALKAPKVAKTVKNVPKTASKKSATSKI